MSYEIYLSHMFVVTALIRVFRMYDADMKWGVLWYLPAVPLCWLLGALVARWLSVPCERWLRARLSKSPVASATPVLASASDERA